MAAACRKWMAMPRNLFMDLIHTGQLALWDKNVGSQERTLYIMG